MGGTATHPGDLSGVARMPVPLTPGRAFRRILAAIGAFFNHPYVRLTVALALLTSGFCELADTALEEFFDVQIGVGHGVVLYAMSESGRVLHTMFEEVETASDVVEAVEVLDDRAGVAE